MLSHFTSDAMSSKHAQQAEHEILSQWIVAQPAYEAPKFGNKAPYSPDQIDAIIAIRKRIAASQQSHD